MKRIAYKLLVFLLLGAIINVAVAWGISFRSTVAIDEVTRGSWPLVDGKLAASRWEGFGEQWVNVTRLRYSSRIAFDEPRPDSPPIETVIPAWSQLQDPNVAFQSDTELDQRLYADALGWPCLSMWCRLKTTRVAERLDDCYQGGIRWSHEKWSSEMAPCVLPMWLLWPGFAINTIFYAAIVWMMVAVPGYLKRRRRIKRGLCVKCAYPVGTNDKCTECGFSLPARK